MSTRRARIKAVTALPPRRKNAAPADCKPKNNSPKQPLPVNTSDQEENKNIPPFEICEQPSVISDNANKSTPRTDQPEKFCSKENETRSVTPSTSTIRNVFVSPIIRNSPKRTFTSPNRPSPQIASKSMEPSKIRTPIHQATPTHHELSENTELRVASNSISKVLQNNADSKVTTDDYNIPSVPESISEDAMDGIVPLQPARITPKPIEKLKNEIISENAEVLFDPIVPLPSPSKVRPKLRPVPRLGPRRNSIQGSASESEDESRRSLLSGGSTTPAPARQRHDSHTPHLTQALNREVSRVRNDSVCSNISQATAQPAPASPLKEKLQKSRRMEASRRLMAMRKRRENVTRETLTMYDLIFFNPSTNPIVPDQDELKAKEENAKEMERQKVEMKEEEKVDDPPENDAAPVPQIKLGPNGEIVLDESSLVIKQTQTQNVSSVVREGAWLPSRGQYKRRARSAEWSASEAVRFYRALAAIGTDFTLMAPLFPERTRRELKLKFKKEEKLNGAQVDKALRSRIEWDAISLQEEFAAEREAEKRKAQEEKEKHMRQKAAEKHRLRATKDIGVRTSRGLRALEVSVIPTARQHEEGIRTVDDILERAKKYENQRKRTMQDAPIAYTNNTATPSLATLSKLNKRRKSKDTPGPVHTVINTPILNQTVSKTNTPTLNQTVSKTNTPTHSVTLSRIVSKTNTPTLNQTVSKTNTPTLNHTVSKINTPTSKTPELVTSLNNIPANIETGSLIVLTVNNPKSPGKKMLQTYIAHEPGKLTQVALPAMFLNSVVGYMKKGTPKSTVSDSSSPLISPNSNDSRTSTPKSSKKTRNSSFSITQL